MKDWFTARNGVGVVALVFFFLLVGDIRRQGEVQVDYAAICLVLLLVAILAFIPWLSDYFAGPFTSIIDSIYYGNDDRERPLLNLKRADYFRTHGLFDKAIREYRKQLRHHPKSPDLWAGLINTALESGDTERARQFRKQAFRRLKGGDRIVLERGTTRR